MKRIFFFFGVVLLLNFHLFAWDRYSNETETIINTCVQGTYIERYSFTLSSTTAVDFYTDNFQNSSGDTYMHLWSNTEERQVYKNDDAVVPSGYPWASRITTTLPAGSYILFIRAYDDQKSGTCTLYRDGSPVKNSTFAGRTYRFYELGAEDRLSTTNLYGSGGDTYCLLLNAYTDDLVGYNDNDRGLSSSIMCPSNGDYKFICGSYSPGYVFFDISRTQDKHLEFISLCDDGQDIINGSAEFTHQFDYSHNPAAPDCYQAAAHLFIEDRLYNTEAGIDNVDFLWIYAHGCPRSVGMYNEPGITLWENLGGGNRTCNRIGDLEYMSFYSCEVTRIEHTKSLNWLENGWISSSTGKGVFDGLHMVVGYHTIINCWESIALGKSGTRHARYFANKLESGKGIWQAWWETNEDVADDYSSWFFGEKNPGVPSCICLLSQVDEKLSDFRSQDIVYGMSDYLFTVRWYGDNPPD